MAETTILLVDSRQTRLKVAVKLALTNLSGIIGLHSGKGIHYRDSFFSFLRGVVVALFNLLVLARSTLNLFEL